MALILENETLCAKISEHGAELTSLYNKKNGIEYIWQGDPAFWGRHSPVLFPIVGRLKNDTYEFENKTYQLSQHGFARDLDFTVTKATDTTATFELLASDETKAKYPFDFKLVLTYTLTENRISFNYTVFDLGDRPMYYGLGAHPAFSTKLLPDDAYTDYQVELAPELKRKLIPLRANLLDLENTSASKTSLLPVTHALFKDDALVYELEEKPLKATLRNTKHGHGVTLTVADAKAFGIWSCYPAQGEFVCLEPWWAVADIYQTTGKFKDKYLIERLDGHQSKNYTFAITVF